MHAPTSMLDGPQYPDAEPIDIIPLLCAHVLLYMSSSLRCSHLCKEQKIS